MDLKLADTGECFDFAVPLQADSSIRNLIMISLYTRAAVDEEQSKTFFKDREVGWWASDIGSKNFLVTEGKPTRENLLALEDFAVESLGWMKRAGLLDNVTVSAILDGGQIDLGIRIKTANNLRDFNFTI